MDTIREITSTSTPVKIGLGLAGLAGLGTISYFGRKYFPFSLSSLSNLSNTHKSALGIVVVIVAAVALFAYRQSQNRENHNFYLLSSEIDDMKTLIDAKHLSKFLKENNYPKGLYFVRWVLNRSETNETVARLVDDVLVKNHQYKKQRIFVLDFHCTDNEKVLSQIRSSYEEGCKYSRLYLSYLNTTIRQDDNAREWNLSQAT